MLPFPFQRVPRCQDLFSEMFGNVRSRRGGFGTGTGRSCCSLIDGLPAVAAELCGPSIGLAAVWTSRWETRPTVVAKDRVKRIVGLAVRANHTKNQLFDGVLKSPLVKELNR